MKRYDVYALGNALVDLEYQVDEAFLQRMELHKGLMRLMDETQRLHLLAALHNDHTLIKRCSGGSAANSAYTVAGMGGRAFYSCRVADDEAGGFYLQDLRQAGIDCNPGTQRPTGHTGTCIVLITEDAERTMQTHLGITAEVSPEDLNPEALAQSRWLYLEGYLAPSASARAAVSNARQLAKTHHIPVALSCSDPSMVRFFREEFLSLLEHNVDLLFCNEEEGLLLSQCSTVEAALEALSQWAPEVVMTRGAEGAIIAHQGVQERIPAFVVSPVDTNGAGDSFAGAYLYGKTHGMTCYDAGILASRTSAEVVTQFGARLPYARYPEILREHQTCKSTG